MKVQWLRQLAVKNQMDMDDLWLGELGPLETMLNREGGRSEKVEGSFGSPTVKVLTECTGEGCSHGKFMVHQIYVSLFSIKMNVDRALDVHDQESTFLLNPLCLVYLNTSTTRWLTWVYHLATWQHHWSSLHTNSLWGGGTLVVFPLKLYPIGMGCLSPLLWGGSAVKSDSLICS